MLTVPASERYNQHVNKSEISSEILRRVVSQIGFDCSKTEFKKLSGGFQNSNYLAECGGTKRILRFYSTDSYVARCETGVLHYLAHQNVKAPRVLDLLDVDGQSVAVHEFLEGHSMQDLLPASSPDLFFAVGAELAKIHLIDLPRAGFIGPEMKIGEEYEVFTPFLRDYILKVFSAVPEARLQANIRDRLLQLVHERWEIVLSVEPAKHLVHCDFNPKNILLDSQGVSAILDWEFCISGNGYIDIGNFFRFPYDFPDYAENSFIAGYRSLKPLSPHWKEIARLLDLGNMASFMERHEDYQKTFRTAREVIASTLEYFAY